MFHLRYEDDSARYTVFRLRYEDDSARYTVFHLRYEDDSARFTVILSVLPCQLLAKTVASG